MKPIIFLGLFFACAALAHQHGVGHVTLAFSENVGKIEFEASGESIVGFEHAPKGQRQEIQEQQALDKVDARINQMIVFDPSLDCRFTKDHVEVRDDAEGSSHSNINASWSVSCKKPPHGTKARFFFQKAFPSLKDVDIIVLMGPLQKTGVARKDGFALELK